MDHHKDSQSTQPFSAANFIIPEAASSQSWPARDGRHSTLLEKRRLVSGSSPSSAKSAAFPPPGTLGHENPEERKPLHHNTATGKQLHTRYRTPRNEPRHLPATFSLLDLGPDDASTRLLFLPSGPEAFDLRHIGIEHKEVTAGAWSEFELQGDGEKSESTEKVAVMAVAQSSSAVACGILTRNRVPQQTAAFAPAYRMYFDPSIDKVTLVNTNDKVIFVSGQDGTVDDKTDDCVRVYPRTNTELSLGSWTVAMPPWTTQIRGLPR
jgi:hypothetical protein